MSRGRIILQAQIETFNEVLSAANLMFDGKPNNIPSEMMRLFYEWRREHMSPEALRRHVQRYYHAKFVSIGGAGLPPALDTSILVTHIMRHMKVWRSSSSL